MDNTEYQAYLKKQSDADLLSIRNSLDRGAYPDRYAMIIAEIEARDKLSVTGSYPTSNNTSANGSARPNGVTPLITILVFGGLLLHLGSGFMSYAEAALTVRFLVAIIGSVMSVGGCISYAKKMGYSGWLGLLGLFGIIGLGILAALPAKIPPPPLPKQLGRRSMGSRTSIFNIYFRFSGRIPRATYWLASIPFIPLGIVAEIFDDRSWSILFWLALIWPAIAVSTKRWHDRDKSGWWNLINFVPLVGTTWSLIECGFLPGTDGQNRFDLPNTMPERMAVTS